MGKRYLTAYHTHTGWTIWIHPLPGYRMRCCDCGLVHDLQLSQHLESGHLLLRVRRSNRATAASRRKKRHERSR